MLCLIKVNSNTIELAVHTACYCVLDSLCVIPTVLLQVSSCTATPAKTAKRRLPVAKRTKTNSCSALEDLRDGNNLRDGNSLRDGNLFVDKLPPHVTKNDMKEVFSK